MPGPEELSPDSQKQKNAADLAAAIGVLAKHKEGQEQERGIPISERAVLEVKSFMLPRIDKLLARLEDLKSGQGPTNEDKAAGIDTPSKLFTVLVDDIKRAVDSTEKILNEDILKNHPERDSLLTLLDVSRQQLSDFEKGPVVDQSTSTKPDIENYDRRMTARAGEMQKTEEQIKAIENDPKKERWIKIMQVASRRAQNARNAYFQSLDEFDRDTTKNPGTADERRLLRSLNAAKAIQKSVDVLMTQLGALADELQVKTLDNGSKKTLADQAKSILFLIDDFTSKQSIFLERVLKENPGLKVEHDRIVESTGKQVDRRVALEKIIVAAEQEPVQTGVKPDFSEVVKHLKQVNDATLIEPVLRALEGRGVDEYFGLGEIANAIGKKSKIAERILKALIKAGLVEQKPGMNEFRKKQAAGTAPAPAPKAPVMPSAPPATPVMPTGAPATPAAPPAAPPAAVPPPKATTAPTAPPASPAPAMPSAPPAAPVMPSTPTKIPNRKELIDTSNEFVKAGNAVAALFDTYDKSGLTAAQTQELVDRLREFLRLASVQMESGLVIQPAARTAYRALESTLNAGSIDNPRRVRDLMNQLYESLEQSFSAQKFSIELPKAAPVIAATPAASASGVPIEIGFEHGQFNVTPAEAFSNEVFFNFFKTFDTARNPTEAFDPTNPDHVERYEKAVEAYRLWREAVDTIGDHLADTMQQDFGKRPPSEALLLLEADLLELIVADTQNVRSMIDRVHEYAGLEEGEARREQEIQSLGGFEKLNKEVNRLELLRIQKRLEIEQLTQALHDLAKQRSAAHRANIVATRNIFAAIDDRAAALGSGSLRDKVRGLIYGKELARLKDDLLYTYGGVSLEDAAVAFSVTGQRARAQQQLVERAIQQYEEIEKNYRSALGRVEQAQFAEQQKNNITTQIQALRLKVFLDAKSFGDIAKLTAGRARDEIKEVLATATETDLPSKVEDAETRMKNLRRAADFTFSADRYAHLPEIVNFSIAAVGEGTIIADADRVLNETVKNAIEKAVQAFGSATDKGAAFVKKTILDFGPRGIAMAETVLPDAIREAKSKSDDQRLFILGSILFQVRRLKNTP